jgi:PAS domain S-box-containing protein
MAASGDDANMDDRKSRSELIAELVKTRARVSALERTRDDSREREALLATAATIAGLGHWVWDEVAGRATFCSKQLARMIGFGSPEEYLAAATSFTALRSWIHPDDWAPYQEKVRAAERTLASVDREFRIVKLDGEIRYVRERSEPVLDDAGALIQTIGTTQDITDLRRAEESMRALEARLKAIADNAPAVICLKDLDGAFIFANASFAEPFGYTVDEVIGKTSRELFPEEIANSMVAQDQAVIDPRQVIEREQLVLTIDGPRIFTDIKFPVLDSSAQPVTVGLIGTDITERKQAEEALRESEARFKAVVENSPNRIYLKDLEGRYLLVNKVYLETMGMSLEEAIGASARDWVPDATAEAFSAHDREVVDSGMMVAREVAVPLSDGTIETHLITKFPVFDADGRVAAVGSIGVDITERKRAEEGARERETLLTHAAAIAGLGHWVWDLVEDRCISCSEELARMIGFSSPEAYVAAAQSHTSTHAWVHPDDWAKYDARTRTAERDKMPVEMEFRIVRLDGGIRHVREMSEPILDEAVLLVRSIGTIQDITDHRRVEEDLRENEARLRLAQEHARIGIFVWDEVEDRTIHRTKLIDEIYGLTLEQTPRDSDEVLSLTHPDDRESHRGAIAMAMTGKPFDIEYRIVRPDGGIWHLHVLSIPEFDEAGTLIRSIGTIQDVTERMQAEEQRRQAQKMEAVGQLTGGIAHDFNNLLAVILGNTELAREEAGDDGALNRYLEATTQAAVRGAELTARLLVFSREQPLSPKTLDLNAVVGGMAELLHRSLGEAITI